MGEVILYSTGCPKCSVLKKKLEKAHIAFSEVHDIDEMRSIGLMSAPALLVGDDLMLFSDAVRWVDGHSQKE